jgi:hypothetical protein
MVDIVKNDTGDIQDLSNDVSNIIVAAALLMDGRVHFYRRGSSGANVAFDQALPAQRVGGAPNNAHCDDGLGNGFFVF